jgi:hypothetical protein
MNNKCPISFPLFEPEAFHLVTIFVRFDGRGELVPHLVYNYVITTHQFFPSEHSKPIPKERDTKIYRQLLKIDLKSENIFANLCL